MSRAKVGFLALSLSFILITSCTGLWTNKEGCNNNCDEEYKKCIDNPKTDRAACFKQQQDCKKFCDQGGVGCSKS
jgi:hypothetical protein